ncbi:MAG: hypothetical protein MTP17_02955 [Candidatus Midichloria sp.]|nr:MAG: hypothetical protein MTP17_02955 [Candidatus Midichloria sp.]
MKKIIFSLITAIAALSVATSVMAGNSKKEDTRNATHVEQRVDDNKAAPVVDKTEAEKR